jgi:ketosteroid isomerase-like protein
MRTTLRVGSALAAFLVCSQLAADLGAQTTAELDAYWAAVSRTVEEGDFQGYAALYHEDAVLVSRLSDNSYPIATALDGWEQGFIDTREGESTAGVDFRFSQRLNDGTTAHETGIFNYRLETSTGEVTDQYVHFSALLVKKDGWKMVMEYQQSVATVDEWNALK